MNAITPYQPAQQIAPAFTMSEMERVALAIAKGGLFGSTDPNAVLTLCMVAQAEGKHPGLVMQQYHIISGKPAKKAEAMLVDFLASGGKVEWHQLDDVCADATFSHPLGGTVRITWDDKRVQQAQLGNNPMHKKYPRQMKRSRCISEGVRTVFPGATSGMYVPEEVQDMVVDQPARATPPVPQAQRARDLTPQRTPEPMAEPQPEQLALASPAPGADEEYDKADKWAQDYVERLRNADTSEKVAGIRKRGAAGLSALRDTYPSLYTRVIEADPASEIQPAHGEEAPAAGGSNSAGEQADPATQTEFLDN